MAAKKKAAKRAPAPARDGHRVCIYEAADSVCEDLRRAEDGTRDDNGEGYADWGAYLSEGVLEIDHLQAPGDADRFRTRFVLGLGGPTVEVCVDSRDGVTFFHSWGRATRRHNAKDLREIELHGVDRQVWERLADYYREGLA